MQTLNFKDMVNISFKWFSVILWVWFLLSYWTDLPIPSFFISNDALTAFIILAIQMCISINIKQALTKDKEFQWFIIIIILTIICMALSNSKPGAFFTVTNFCMILYLSDKWSWNHFQIILLGSCLFFLVIYWLVKPILLHITDNSNWISTIIVFSTFSLISMIEYFFHDKKWKYIPEYLLIGLCFYQLFKFKGRGSFIALLFYCFLRYIMPQNWWNKEKIFKFCCFFLTIGSIIFAVIYVLLWLNVESMQQLTLLGKKIFSGREVIWYEFLSLFLKQPFYGTGTNFTPQNYFEFNVHNAMLDILTVHGIIVFTLVVIFIIKKIIKLYKMRLENPVIIPVIAGIMAVFLESFTDMDLLWTPQLMVYSFSFVILNSIHLRNDRIKHHADSLQVKRGI